MFQKNFLCSIAHRKWSLMDSICTNRVYHGVWQGKYLSIMHIFLTPNNISTPVTKVWLEICIPPGNLKLRLCWGCVYDLHIYRKNMMLLLSLSKVSKVYYLLIIFRLSFWKLLFPQDITYFSTLLLYSGTGERVIHIPEKEIVKVS